MNYLIELHAEANAERYKRVKEIMMSERKPVGGIRQQMSKIQDRVGIMAHGIDYLIERCPPALQPHDAAARPPAQAVAKITGGNAEDIAYKEKRTPEQERLLIELAGKEWLTRWAKFRNSDYTQVLEALFSRFEGTGDRPADLTPSATKTRCPYTILRFTFTPRTRSMTRWRAGN